MASTLLFLLATAAPVLQTDVAEEPANAVATAARQYTPAVQIESSAPVYPPIELRHGKEAWVRVAYCIDESGKPRNVSILDSVGGERFDKAALETVKTWEFEPALTDGEPSWQSRNQIYITFAIDGNSKGASRKFARQYRELGELIDDEKLEESDELFRDIYENSDLSLYELSKLWVQRVRYEALRGDLRQLDTALHRATASNGRWIEKESYIELLSLHVEVELQLGQFHAAMEAYEKLQALSGDDSKYVAALRPTIEKVQNYIDSDQILSVKGEVRTSSDCLTCQDSWSFTPVRDDFKFTNVSGKLESVEMRCDHNRFESAVSDLLEWHIPETWGTCHVQVYGDPGTTFDVLLLPKQDL